MRNWRLLLIALCTTALMLGACSSEPDIIIEPTPTFDPFVVDAVIPDEIIRQAEAENLLLQAIYARVSPSVVGVEVLDDNGVVARGSGFVFDRNGRIITNAHLVLAGDAWRVIFHDGYTVNSALLGYDLYSDLAVLSVTTPPDRLLPVTFANSDQVLVGSQAVFIGNPYGLSNSITYGIIGGIGRQLPSATLANLDLPPSFQNPRILQTSMPIPLGGNGGVVLNNQGAVIGLGVEVASVIGLYHGVGFAIPSNTVSRVVPDLIRDGQVSYAWLGINTVQTSYNLSSLANELGLGDASGVLVTQVSPDSPASDAGLLGGNRYTEAFDMMICNGGDIITAVNGVYINHIDDLVYYLLIHHIPGDVVDLMILRNGQPMQVSVILGERPTTTFELPPCGDAVMPERGSTVRAPNMSE
jgi:2-alkenal reductase